MSLRNPTLDVVRGLTSLEMVFVNLSSNPLTSHAPYISQTPSTGLTYADTIFPTFAFLSGMSYSPLSSTISSTTSTLSSSPAIPTPTSIFPSPILRRSTSLVGIGLALHTTYSTLRSLPIRIPGVLQRLGVATYLAGSPELSILQKYHGLPLLALWYTISLLGSTSRSSNPLAHPSYLGTNISDTAASRIDIAVFGERHLHTPSWDPEGLLGCLTTAVSMLLGRWYASSLAELSILQQVGVGIGGILLGESGHYLLPKYAPVSKSLWSPSFVAVAGGWAVLKFVAVGALMPYLPVAVRTIFEDVGRRSLEIYVLSSLVGMGLNYGGERSLWIRSRKWLGGFLGGDGGDAVMCVGVVGGMAAAAGVMVDRGLRLRI